MKLPKAKTGNIVVQNLKGETLIYNLTTNQAFCLNETAAKVFESCDGKTSFDEVKNKYQLSADLIFLALDRLKKENLIEDEYVSPFAGMNRREVMRKVGLASMIALPVISAMVAPVVASAASTVCGCSAPARSNARLENCPCGDNSDCCGLCILATNTCSAPQAGSQGTAASCCPRLLV